jgi:hypothetical protein
MFAAWAASLNCDSRYLGRNVYRPAIGRMWRTLLAVRNIRMSFLKSRFTAFGKSAMICTKIISQHK